MTRSCLVDQKTIKGKKTGAYIVEESHVSIDTINDLKLAEFFLKK